MKHCGKGMEALMLLFVLVMIVPVCILAVGSFMGEDELTLKLGAILGTGDGYAELTLAPVYPTLKAYVEVLLDTPEFFVMFWNSVKITAGSLAVQLIFGTLAAWGFAKWEFPLKKALLWLYIVLMLMPFQVLMLSDYLVLQRLNLLDSHLGLILLCGFSTFPVFIMYRFFCGIPDEVMEAARLDGAGDIKLFFYIGLPLGKSGIFSAMILGFLENWSMIEQPMTFLKTKSLWPLSILLPEIEAGSIGFAFGVSVLTFLPALLIFLNGQEYLEKGISASQVKQ
ncbi:MAG: carbohydrate ABC transporter permease [Lachnospiraceae bacterium]|nr:carbohydrate ABC transporter permease [Lachnospiraceae bacterium]